MPDEIKKRRQFMVLIVDDDPLQRREIKRCLTDDGFATCEADNGKEAIDVIHKDRPDVIIMDIKMPKLDGVGVVKALVSEKAEYQPKIILMTGDPDSLYQANQMRLNVFGVIEKPVPLRVLSRFIENAYSQSDRV